MSTPSGKPRSVTPQRLGFIGVGTMGEPMARRLLAAGFAVTVCPHRRTDAVERLVSLGASRAADAAGVAAASDAVVVCVPDAPQVEEVLFAERGIVRGARAGCVVIDTSTISPDASRRFAERLAPHGIAFTDAPVSGGPARAAEGTLTVMVGADPDVYARIEPVLRAFGTPHHVGPVGAGEVVKLTNQLIIAGVMIADAEALSFARKAGLDLDTVRTVLAGATGNNYLLEHWLPRTWFAGTFDGGFALDLLRKDLAAALDTAERMRLPLPLSALAHQLYTAQSAAGDGSRDYSVIATFYERSDRS
jgi:3-hydroxyisobutyrate dehydrogenase-like beta-hydroxyacid dehydrogenase